ncbi:MAG: DUF3368 domain-containing protein [Thermoplasmata archaeon]
MGLKVHGTLGLVIRAYRESLVDRSKVEEILEALYEDSSLFITPKIVKKAKVEMSGFSKGD